MTITKHPTIAMSPVKSSQIHSIGHDPATNTMAIRALRPPRQYRSSKTKMEI